MTVGSVQRRPDGKWRARYRDLDGRERSRHFARRTDAQRWLVGVEADKARGLYVSPDAGSVTFETCARGWLAARVCDPSTVEALEARLRLYILPALGHKKLRDIRPSTLQTWIAQLNGKLAPRTVEQILGNAAAILQTAVEDGVIPANPARSKTVAAPRPDRSPIVPWTAQQVADVAAAVPRRYQAVVYTAAAAGLRQGETFGLAADDIDPASGFVHVRRQVKIVAARPVFALPKGRKTRDVPLPESLAAQLEGHTRRTPPASVTLPWRQPDGRPHTARLLFTTREHNAIARRYYNPHVWKPALRAAGIPPTRDNGMHALRHFYASVLLDAGESVRSVAEWLGHADPAFTLRVYAHLIPGSDTRTRAAIDKALNLPAD